MCFTVFLAYTGAAGIMYAQSISDGVVGSTATKQASSMVFQGIYMLMFAALLFIYECVQLCPCEFIDTGDNILSHSMTRFHTNPIVNTFSHMDIPH